MTTAEIRARLDEIEAGFGYYHRLSLLAALRAALDVSDTYPILAASEIREAIADALGLETP